MGVNENLEKKKVKMFEVFIGCFMFIVGYEFNFLYSFIYFLSDWD